MRCSRRRRRGGHSRQPPRGRVSLRDEPRHDRRGRAVHSIVEHRQIFLHVERLAADAGYGSAENLARLVQERGIGPHIPVFAKSQCTDGT